MAKQLSGTKKLIAMIRKDEAKNKLKILKFRCKCNHQSKNEKLWAFPMKKDESILRCEECHTKIDMGAFEEMSAEEIKKEIKAVGKEMINWINIAKIQMNPKHDGAELKFFGDVQYGIVRASKLLRAYIGDNFEVHRKGKKKKSKNKKRGTRINTGGRSMRFR